MSVKKLKSIIVVFLVMILMGCSSSETQENSKDLDKVTTSSIESKSFLDNVIGIYEETEVNEDSRHLIEISSVGGVILIDHQFFMDDELFSFYVQEIRPEDNSVLFSESTNEITAKNLSFSMMSNAGMYWHNQGNLSITVLDDIVTLEYFNDENPHTETYQKIEESSLYAIEEVQTNIFDHYQVETIEDSLCGEWSFQGDYGMGILTLNTDGTFIYALKDDETPITVIKGMWGVNDHQLILAGYQLGAGTMMKQWIGEWNLKEKDAQSDSDILYITDIEENDFIVNSGGVIAFTADENVKFFNELYTSNN